jgi:apolipoprotein N-acyltransferase
MSAVTKTAKATGPSLRILFSSLRVRDGLVAAVAGLALSLAFPRIGAEWLAPFGTAALFWTWQNASWKRAFAYGWLGGVVFFSISFAWWSHTLGGAIGPFWAGAAVFVSAMIEAVAWGATGAAAVFARERAPAALAPISVAAAFTVMEALRSVGPFGVPFAQLGYSQADTPLRVFAAYAGTYGITFVLCALGAYLADAIIRGTVRPLGLCLLSVACAWLACWIAWPARHAAPATIPVAAVQGDITQTLKWQPGSLALAVRRYTTMTSALVSRSPKLVVWPETVITERGIGLNEDPLLEQRFAALARMLRATIVVGSIGTHDESYYNSLFFFSPGLPVAEYDKRQLVPFAEDFPGARFLWWLPYVGSLNGGFSSGTVNGVYPTAAGLRAAPQICWESAFADLVHAQVARGAQLLVVSTDDAWFGTTSGPYQHAQIAQLRAIENGVWVVQAAATGVSGIIAPDGDWTAQSAMNERVNVLGTVGPPTGSPFARIGPTPIVALLALVYVASVISRRGGRA